MKQDIRFLEGNDFTLSLRALNQKGGFYQKAAKTVQAAWGRAHTGDSYKNVFQGMPLTNNGENRIPHCIKYDLTKFSRLITVLNNGICIFLYCGDHDTVDKWLEKNRGLDFIGKEYGDQLIIDKVRISNLKENSKKIYTESDWSTGALLNLLPKRYLDKLLQDLPQDVINDLLLIESIATDDEIQNTSLLCNNNELQTTIMDVLLSLKSGDVINAKNCIDIYSKQVIPLVKLEPEQISKIKSGETTVLVSDIDPILFQHFIQTASFEQWMLYLHPSQRDHADKDFEGSTKLAGVSGSGKTCVVVHRALRLAQKYSDDTILVITLNSALAALINRLISALNGDKHPNNIKVSSIFDLCYEKLIEMEPEKKDYYTKQTITKNSYAISEHIDEIWLEYFMCHHNNYDADVWFKVIQTLNIRGIYASDYLRQEIDFIRSGFMPGDRDKYLEIIRDGRIVPLIKRDRLYLLNGLANWERKMEAVGAIDDMGIVTALSKHIETLKPEYRCALVDEVQDLGTLELSILRKLTKIGENDLFLSGDAAQTIYTKFSKLEDAGIFLSSRPINLKQNYRNSRQILKSAYVVLTKSLDSIPKCALHLEVLPPEYASFSSPNPLLLKANSIVEEFCYAINYLKDLALSVEKNQRFCVVICGYSQSSIEILGKTQKLPVLSAKIDVRDHQIFISDLEQTKGFEFDTVVIINCTSTIIPHPMLPIEESFRDLSRLYVAMTRAKTQLLISYHGNPSKFIEVARDTFTEGDFSEHVENIIIDDVNFPHSAIPELKNPEVLKYSGKSFLKSPDAVGLSRSVQDAILKSVTGKNLISGSSHKQLEWEDFGSFFSSMQNRRYRTQVISEEAWQLLNKHFHDK